MQDAFIAVHGGAGTHSEALEKGIKRALRDACMRALSLASTGEGSALAMVDEATSVLEDDPHLNAGYGSNLTIDGTVECDAAVMTGQFNLFGSVGAVSGIKNPVKLARSILTYSRISDKLGRIPPLTLVSEGATAFARSQARTTLEIVSPNTLITPTAREQWERWKGRLEVFESSHDSLNHPWDLNSIQDTVGSVSWHPADGMAASVSSGGLLLKYPGRIGEAGVYGAGCWAQQQPPTLQGIACTISGTGEHIIRSMLARKIGEKIMCSMSHGESDIHGILEDALGDFSEIFQKEGGVIPSSGVVLLVRQLDEESNASVKLWCAFTTRSMAVAYASSRQPKPKAIILRHPDSSAARDWSKPRIFITAVSL